MIYYVIICTIYIRYMKNISVLVAVLTQSDIADIIPPVNIVKPTINVPTISVPTSSWKPDNFATWPFITISGVSGKISRPQPRR